MSDDSQTPDDRESNARWSGTRGTIIREAHFPGRAPIDAYGNGGFRFADMSHRGSILALPSGIYGWSAVQKEDVDLDRLDRAIAERSDFDLLLIGLGSRGDILAKETRRGLKDAGIHFEMMSTGSAIRTFNVLLAEERPVAAALLAVESAG